MPLLLSRQHPAGPLYSIWRIAEAEDFFDVALTSSEATELSALQGLRRQEWLASRWLIHQLTGSSERLPLAKDAFSKPFFLDKPHLYCSLSHSKGLVGALLSEQPCGCDLQVLVDKMARIAPKFLSQPEVDFIQTHPPDQHLLLQHIFWTAKESLYKAYGLKALDFRRHLRVDPFVWADNKGQALGWIQKEGMQQIWHLYFEYVCPADAPPFVWTTVTKNHPLV